MEQQSLITILRSYRLFGYAMIDFVAGALGIYLLSPILIKIFDKFGIKTTKKNWLWLSVVIGVIFHMIFAPDTPLNQKIFSLNDGYFEKIFLIFTIYMGTRNYKKK